VRPDAPADGYIGGAMGDERRFRFLSDEEYAKLSHEQRTAYLSAAAEALQWRQEQLRKLIQELVRENRTKTG
jgi:TRAP-type C4-dicarboxylate transport system substrate-binding protein